MTTDYRVLATELLKALDSYPVRPQAHRELCHRAAKLLGHTEIDPVTEILDYYAQLAARSQGKAVYHGPQS